MRGTALLPAQDWPERRGDERSERRGWNESYSRFGPSLEILFRVNAHYLRSPYVGMRERFSRRQETAARKLSGRDRCERATMRPFRDER
jgi:hypothetical protein